MRDLYATAGNTGWFPANLSSDTSQPRTFNSTVQPQSIPGTVVAVNDVWAVPTASSPGTPLGFGAAPFGTAPFGS